MFVLQLLLCIFVLGCIVFFNCIKDLVIGVDNAFDKMVKGIKERFFTKDE